MIANLFFKCEGRTAIQSMERFLAIIEVREV